MEYSVGCRSGSCGCWGAELHINEVRGPKVEEDAYALDVGAKVRRIAQPELLHLKPRTWMDTWWVQMMK